MYRDCHYDKTFVVNLHLVNFNVLSFYASNHRLLPYYLPLTLQYMNRFIAIDLDSFLNIVRSNVTSVLL